MIKAGPQKLKALEKKFKKYLDNDTSPKDEHERSVFNVLSLMRTKRLVYNNRKNITLNPIAAELWNRGYQEKHIAQIMGTGVQTVGTLLENNGVIYEEQTNPFKPLSTAKLKEVMIRAEFAKGSAKELDVQISSCLAEIAKKKIKAIKDL